MSDTKDVLYFDYAATTPVDPAVLETYIRVSRDLYANPSSDRNVLSWKAQEAIEGARKSVASLVGCKSSDVFFTSGATESCNWVLQSKIRSICAEKKRPARVLALPIEHPAVIATLYALKAEGQCELIFFELDDVGALKNPELPVGEYDFVSMMWVQNELGEIYPIHKIASTCRERNIPFFTDATQAVGKIAIHFEDSKADYLCFSGHKIYAPKGTGVLIRREGMDLPPLIHGGGQERGLRSGTLNAPGVVALGKGCDLLRENLGTHAAYVQDLKTEIREKIYKAFPSVRWNQREREASPYILSATFLEFHVPAFFKEVAVSKSSACKSGPVEMSTTLEVLGFSATEQAQTLRISLSHLTTRADGDRLVEILQKHIRPPY